MELKAGKIADHFKTFGFAYLSFIVVAVFFSFNFQALNLPFYWDEAWVYGPAVRMMADSTPSLLPDSLPVEFSRGHPLLFHFLNAVWLKIFGNTVFQAHLFNLIIACLLLLAVYVTGKRIFSPLAGFLAVFFLGMQPVFLAQSVLVLPEVMLAVFVLIALVAFLENKKILYVVAATAALLTKESGIIVPIYVASYYVIRLMINKSFSLRKNLTDIAVILIPLLIFAIFLSVQYLERGWFFFPEHTGYLDFAFGHIKNKFIDGYSAYLFIYQGRNLLFFTGIAALLILLVLRKKLQQVELIIFFLAFIFIFLLFSSVNFFSNRYIICVIPLFLILIAGLLSQVIAVNRLFLIVLPLFVVVQIQLINKKSNADHDLGYRDAVVVNTQIIDYMQKENLREKPVMAYFIARYLLTNHYSGYVEQGKAFSRVTDEFSNAEYYLFSNFDMSPEYNARMNNSDIEVVKRYERGKAWVALYHKKK